MNAVTVNFGHKILVFSKTSELISCLEEALSEASFTGGPWLMVGQDAVPAWGWLGDVLRLRPAWREEVGIAVQHAASGGALGAQALVDLCANERASTLILDYTEPMRARLGAVQATQTATGWGGRRDATLAEVLRDARAYWDAVTGGDREVVLGDGRVVALVDAAALETLLGETARAGAWQRTAWGDGPWSFLHEEVMFRAWAPAALPDILARLLAAGEAEVAASLDWLGDGYDSAKFLSVINDLCANHPTWWGQPAKRSPQGWRRPLRPASWPFVKSLGDVVVRLQTRAREAAAQLPVRDVTRLA